MVGAHLHCAFTNVVNATEQLPSRSNLTEVPAKLTKGSYQKGRWTLYSCHLRSGRLSALLFQITCRDLLIEGTILTLALTKEPVTRAVNLVMVVCHQDTEEQDQKQCFPSLINMPGKNTSRADTNSAVNNRGDGEDS